MKAVAMSRIFMFGVDNFSLNHYNIISQRCGASPLLFFLPRVGEKHRRAAAEVRFSARGKTNRGNAEYAFHCRSFFGESRINQTKVMGEKTSKHRRLILTVIWQNEEESDKSNATDFCASTK